MEDLVLSPFNAHAFFDTVYGQKNHSSLYYGLTSKEPCVPLLFQTFPNSHPFHLRAEGAAEVEGEELKRIEDLKTILHSFILSNIQQLNAHVRDHHRHDFEQLLRVLLYDHELDHLSFFFTKLFYTNLLYPKSPVANARSTSNLEYPSVLAPSFNTSKGSQVDNVSRNAIALLAKQKMEQLGIHKKQNTNSKRRNASRVSPKLSQSKQKLVEIQEVFTVDHIYDLDVNLFPTAERSRDKLTDELLNGTTPSVDSPKTNPSKNAKRKKRKQKNASEQTNKDEVKKTLEKIVAEEAAEQAALEEQKKKNLQEAQKKQAAAELRAKQEKERKEKQRKEREEKLRLEKQQREEEKRKKQQEERQRKAEEKKRQQEERELQKRIEKEAEELFRVHGNILAEELIEEVVCSLCKKLAERSIHEANKLRDKQRKEEEELQKELIRQNEIKQRKKEQREARRQFRNREAEILWNSLMAEVIQEECHEIANNFLRDYNAELQRKHLREIELLRQQRMMPTPREDFYTMESPHSVPFPHRNESMFPGHPGMARGYSNHLYNPVQPSGPPLRFSPPFDNRNQIEMGESYNHGPPSPYNMFCPPTENPSHRPVILKRKECDIVEPENDMEESDVPEHLQSELRKLIGEDFDDTTESTSPQTPSYPSLFSDSFQVFGGVPSEANHHFVRPPLSKRDFDFDPALTVLISNLPDGSDVGDLFEFLGKSFSFDKCKRFLMVPRDRSCCFVQVLDEEDLATILQLDGHSLKSNIVRITPSGSSVPSLGLGYGDVDKNLQRFDSQYLPFGNNGNEFHVEPFVVNRGGDCDLPPGLQTRVTNPPFTRHVGEGEQSLNFSFSNNLQPTSPFSSSLPSSQFNASFSPGLFPYNQNVDTSPNFFRGPSFGDAYTATHYKQ